MKYGNQLPSGAIARSAVMLLVGALVCIAASMAVGFPLRPTVILVGFGLLAFLVIILVAGAVAYSQSVEVEDGRITLFLFGRPIHTEQMSDLVAVERRFHGLFPVVFRFRNGSRIHFLGAHLREIDRMIADLASSVPLEHVKKRITMIEYSRV